MSKAIASNARWKASTPASCSTRWTTSTACSIPMRIRDFTRFGFNEALFPGQALPQED